MKSTMVRFAFAASAAIAAVLSTSPGLARPVTTDDLLKAQDNAGEWLMYGRDYRNWRYSPLAEITPNNAASPDFSHWVSASGPGL
jgi:glucose dehydrogenase